MPYGVPQGSRVEVVAQFSDANGNPVVPPPAVVFLNIAYTALGVSTLASIGMFPIGYSFIAAWNSSAADIDQQAVISFTVGSVTLSPSDPILRINRNT